MARLARGLAIVNVGMDAFKRGVRRSTRELLLFVFSHNKRQSNTENAAVCCAAPKPELQAFLSFCVPEIVIARSSAVRIAGSELTVLLEWEDKNKRRWCQLDLGTGSASVL